MVSMRILNCIRNGFHILGLSTFFLWSGCTTDLPRPNVTSQDDPSKEWSKLLEQISTEQGIDWATLEANRKVLDKYVAWTGTVGPQTNRRNRTPFPKRGRTNRRFVHFVNAYNAWILYGYLEQGKPKTLKYMTDGNGFSPKHVFTSTESTRHLRTLNLNDCWRIFKIHESTLCCMNCMRTAPSCITGATTLGKPVQTRPYATLLTMVAFVGPNLDGSFIPFSSTMHRTL